MLNNYRDLIINNKYKNYVTHYLNISHWKYSPPGGIQRSQRSCPLELCAKVKTSSFVTAFVLI